MRTLVGTCRDIVIAIRHRRCRGPIVAGLPATRETAARSILHARTVDPRKTVGSGARPGRFLQNTYGRFSAGVTTAMSGLGKTGRAYDRTSSSGCIASGCSMAAHGRGLVPPGRLGRRRAMNGSVSGGRGSWGSVTCKSIYKVMKSGANANTRVQASASISSRGGANRDCAVEGRRGTTEQGLGMSDQGGDRSPNAFFCRNSIGHKGTPACRIDLARPLLPHFLAQSDPLRSAEIRYVSILRAGSPTNAVRIGTTAGQKTMATGRKSGGPSASAIKTPLRKQRVMGKVPSNWDCSSNPVWTLVRDGVDGSIRVGPDFLATARDRPPADPAVAGRHTGCSIRANPALRDHTSGKNDPPSPSNRRRQAGDRTKQAARHPRHGQRPNYWGARIGQGYVKRSEAGHSAT